MYYTDVSVNIWAVLAAGAVSMVVGFLWYSPALFGKRWMKEMGWTPEKMEQMKRDKKGMGKTHTLSFIATLVTGYVLGILISIVGIFDTAEAIKLAVILWAGFVVPVMFTEVLFGGKSRTLFVINAGYQLASVILMAVLLAWWQ